MRILLTNDDGIHHPGLAAIRDCLAREHEVTVVAPDRERSAVSHAITLNMPLRVTALTQNGVSGYAVTGTPADCVKLAVLELMDQRPDVVVSGVNPGPNVGINLNYSGTVSAAKEAAILGLAAVAVSVAGPDSVNFGPAAAFACSLVRLVQEKGLPRQTFLNVNVPDVSKGEIRGVKVCRQGRARLEEAFHKRTDPRNQVYYWQGSETQLFGDSTEEDGVALAENYIAVTPVRCDMTEYGLMQAIEEWGLEIP